MFVIKSVLKVFVMESVCYGKCSHGEHNGGRAGWGSLRAGLDVMVTGEEDKTKSTSQAGVVRPTPTWSQALLSGLSRYHSRP